MLHGKWQEGHLQPTRYEAVLLVDPDPQDFAYFRYLLEAAGWKVKTCNSFVDGARWLDVQRFDLVLLSQGTHDFEGRLVLERAMEISRQMSVVVIARCMDMDCYLEAMQLGAVDYLAEPVAVAELMRVVENHTQLRKAG